MTNLRTYFSKVTSRKDEEKKISKNNSTSSIRIADATELKNTEDDIRILKLEKEIVSYALDRLHEVETEGKIIEDKRIFLKNKYTTQMRHLEELISKKEMLIDLHKLEEKKNNLMKTFQKKLDEISKSIDRIQEDMNSF